MTTKDGSQRAEKTRIVQQFHVRFIDGREVVACCGPAVRRVFSTVAAYHPVGESHEGTCCH